MGHGSPSFPVCQKCNNNMKGLYQQQYERDRSTGLRKNPLRRLPEMFACFDSSHEVVMFPEPPFIRDLSWILYGWDAKKRDHELVNELVYKSMKKAYGEEYAKSWAEIENGRTYAEKEFNYWNHVNRFDSTLDSSMPRLHRIKMVFSDGKIGDYIVDDNQKKLAEKRNSVLEKDDTYWGKIDRILDLIGVRREGTDTLPYIYTVIILDGIIAALGSLIHKREFEPFSMSQKNRNTLARILSSPTTLDEFYLKLAIPMVEYLKNR
ncbi:MAG: hypothetical protein ACYDAZ_01835 [Thermoplasmataceae archaeon]